MYSAHNMDSLLLDVTGRPCYERELLSYYQRLYNNNIGVVGIYTTAILFIPCPLLQDTQGNSAHAMPTPPRHPRQFCSFHAHSSKTPKAILFIPCPLLQDTQGNSVHSMPTPPRHPRQFCSCHAHSSKTPKAILFMPCPLLQDTQGNSAHSMPTPPRHPRQFCSFHAHSSKTPKAALISSFSSLCCRSCFSVAVSTLWNKLLHGVGTTVSIIIIRRFFTSPYSWFHVALVTNRKCMYCVCARVHAWVLLIM